MSSLGKVIDCGLGALETALAVVITLGVFGYWVVWCSWRDTADSEGDGE